MPPTTALVSRDVATRTRLAAYFEAAGFQIEQLAQIPAASSATSMMVCVISEGDITEAAASIRSWLSSGVHRHAVIVTRFPRTLREALRFDEGKLQIIVAPVFPWLLVDALRAAARSMP